MLRIGWSGIPGATWDRWASVGRWLLAACLLLPAACSSNRVEPPAIAADEAGRLALDEYDTDKDGLLTEKELARSPALRAAVKTIDKNHDGKISADEIADRIRTYQATRVGLVVFACRVLVDERPLAEATVTLLPEKFLGPNVKPATGVTGKDGMAQLRTEGAPVAGVACGLYRVAVAKKNARGQECIPARYNTQTTLGLEVAPDTMGKRSVVPFRLSGSP